MYQCLASQYRRRIPDPMSGPNLSSIVPTRAGIGLLIGVVFLGGIAGAVLRSEKADVIIGFATLVIVTLLGMLQQQYANIKQAEKVEEVKVSADAAAVKVEEVRREAKRSTGEVFRNSEKLDNLTAGVDRVHTLVNSAHLKLLLTVAELQRSKANRPDASPDDQVAADRAEREYQEHLAKQEEVDRKTGKAAES